jgi:hypothetical protein
MQEYENKTADHAVPGGDLQEKLTCSRIEQKTHLNEGKHRNCREEKRR